MNIKEIEEQHMMELVAISVIASCNTEKSFRINVLDADSPYRTPAYSDVCNAVQREIKLLKETTK